MSTPPNWAQVKREVTRRIIASVKPQRILLFGSAIRGGLTADSDLDLLVIESEVFNTRQEGLRLRSALQGCSLPIDVMVMSRQRFEETKDVIGGLAYPAHKYGKVVYEAA